MEKNAKELENKEIEISNNKYALKRGKRKPSKNTIMICAGILLVGGLITTAILVPSLMKDDSVDKYRPKGTKLNIDDPDISSLTIPMEKQAAEGSKDSGKFIAAYMDGDSISFQYKNNDAINIFKNILEAINKENAAKVKISNEKLTTTIEFRKSNGIQRKIVYEFKGTKELTLVIDLKDEENILIYMNKDILDEETTKKAITRAIISTWVKLDTSKIKQIENAIKNGHEIPDTEELKDLYSK